MSNLKLKIVYKDFNFEAEGETLEVKNLLEDIKSSFLNKLLETSTPVIEEKGTVILENTKTASCKKKSRELGSAAKKKGIPSPKEIDLGLSKEQFLNMQTQFDAYSVKKSAATVIPVLFYLYNKQTGQQNGFDLNLTFTLLRKFGVIVPKNLNQALIDIKNKKQYLTRNEEEGTYSLHYLGEQFVEGLPNK